MQYIQGTTAQSQPMKINENTDICNIYIYSLVKYINDVQRKQQDVNSRRTAEESRTTCFWSSYKESLYFPTLYKYCIYIRVQEKKFDCILTDKFPLSREMTRLLYNNVKVLSYVLRAQQASNATATLLQRWNDVETWVPALNVVTVWDIQLGSVCP